MRVIASIIYLFLFLLGGNNVFYAKTYDSYLLTSNKQNHQIFKGKSLDFNSSTNFFDDSENDDTEEDSIGDDFHLVFSDFTLNTNSFLTTCIKNKPITSGYTANKFKEQIRIVLSPVRIQIGLFRI